MGRGLLDFRKDEMYAEPSALASIGRGYMDIYEPLRQGYEYLANGPEAGRQYRDLKRAEDELYARGLNKPENPFGFDPWRVVGRTAVAAPFLGGASAAHSALTSNMAWETFDAVRRAWALHKAGLLGPVK